MSQLIEIRLQGRHRKRNRSENSSSKRTGTETYWTIRDATNHTCTFTLTSSRNFTTDNGVFVDEFSFDTSLWWFAGISEYFHFHYFHDHDWNPIESEISEFLNPDISNYENVDRSGLECGAWTLASLLIIRLNTWEYLCSPIDIGKHNFQGEYFSIIFTLAEPFSIRNKKNQVKIFSFSSTLTVAWVIVRIIVGQWKTFWDISWTILNCAHTIVKMKVVQLPWSNYLSMIYLRDLLEDHSLTT